MHSHDTTDVSAPSDNTGTGTNSWAALAVLLCGTFLGTVNNNIVNVPLRDIAATYDVDASRSVLVVVGFLLPFAVAMPLMGWLGDRSGRRRVYVGAMFGLVVGALGAASAPSLITLVAFRALQGIATAAILPTVMGMIADIFTPSRRARAFSFWAAVNGIGQAVGPPVGGALTSIAGWRWVFIPLVPAALLVIVGTLVVVPRDRGRPLPLDLRGATFLTLGSALLIAAATLAGLPNVPGLVTVATSLLGVLALLVFGRLSVVVPRPFIPGSLILEPRFLRSCVAATAQMFALGTTLVAVPLYLTGTGGMSVAVVGLIVFAFPATMALLAPVSGLVTERYGPRWVARSGLLLLAAAQIATGWYLAESGTTHGVVAALLILGGAGVAFVQTPVATAATRSPAGASGAALGLFNLVRFSASAFGAAWVALIVPGERWMVLFAVSAVVVILGLVGTYVGEDPPPA